MHDGGGGGGASGGVVGAGNGGGAAGAGAGAEAGADTDADPGAAAAPDGAGVPLEPWLVPAVAGEGAAAPGCGTPDGVAGPNGAASVTDATGTAFQRAPSVGTSARLRACTPSGARAACPPSESRATSPETSPESTTTISAVDEASAHMVATLLLRDRARTRRDCRLRPDPILGFGAVPAFVAVLDLAAVFFGLVGSCSSQKDVFRSQNESTINPL